MIFTKSIFINVLFSLTVSFLLREGRGRLGGGQGGGLVRTSEAITWGGDGCRVKVKIGQNMGVGCS